MDKKQGGKTPVGGKGTGGKRGPPEEEESDSSNTVSPTTSEEKAVKDKEKFLCRRCPGLHLAQHELATHRKLHDDQDKEREEELNAARKGTGGKKRKNPSIDSDPALRAVHDLRKRKGNAEEEAIPTARRTFTAPKGKDLIAVKGALRTPQDADALLPPTVGGEVRGRMRRALYTHLKHAPIYTKKFAGA